MAALTWFFSALVLPAACSKVACLAAEVPPKTCLGRHVASSSLQSSCGGRAGRWLLRYRHYLAKITPVTFASHPSLYRRWKAGKVRALVVKGLSRLPVTEEIAGSNPVERAKLLILKPLYFGEVFLFALQGERIVLMGQLTQNSISVIINT